MYRSFFYTVIAVILVASASWLGYKLYHRFNQPSESPFTAIPGNTALIIQLNKAGNLLEELNRSNLLWKALSRFPGIISVKNELRYVDSVSRKNEDINKIFRQQQVLISITLSGRSNFGALYLTSAGGIDPESYITEFITELGSGKSLITESPYSNTTLHRIQAKGSRDAFYFAVYKGVFMGSFHADLVKRSLDRLLLNTPMAASAGFRKVAATAGKKVDANVYVNYRFFSLVLSKITQDALLPDLISFSTFADWSGLDLIVKKDELLFNGTTVASDSNQQFLSFFADQKPQNKELAAVIPDQTLYFTVLGWSDPASFCQRFQNRTPGDEGYSQNQKDVLTLIDRYQLNVTEYFLPWVGNEGSLFVMENPETFAKIPFLAFHSRDTIRTTRSLMALADTLGLKTDSGSFKGHRIYRLPLPAFIPALFGDLFSKVDVRCFAYLKDYVIFAGNVKDIERVILAFSERATLGNDKTFRDFDDELPRTSNVYSYFNSEKAINTLKSYLNGSLADQFSPIIDSLRKFRSVAFQYSNSEGLFYSNIFLRYDPNLDREGPLQWQIQLDTTLAGRPVILPITKSGAHAVLASDVSGNLYMVSAEGHIQWKKPLMGKLRGSINTIDMGGGDSLSLIFNTDTHLYILRADGQFADKFPMRFPLNATNEIVVARDLRSGENEVFIAFQDNRVYAFTLDGISVQSWKRPKMNETILKPVTVLTGKNRTAIFITDMAGNTLITDRSGTPMISPEPKFTHSPSSGFYLNRSPKRGTFLTTGPSGKVVFIQENGRISEVTMNIFSPEHHFFYEDISDNGQPEFIFTDRNMIYYHNRNYKLTYSYAFRREIATPPFLIRGNGSKVMIGFVVPETNELFLFDKKGYRELESGIRGNTPFDIGILDSRTHLSLVVGAGKFLKNYRLPQL